MNYIVPKFSQNWTLGAVTTRSGCAQRTLAKQLSELIKDTMSSKWCPSVNQHAPQLSKHHEWNISSFPKEGPSWFYLMTFSFTTSHGKTTSNISPLYWVYFVLKSCMPKTQSEGLDVLRSNTLGMLSLKMEWPQIWAKFQLCTTGVRQRLLNPCGDF